MTRDRRLAVGALLALIVAATALLLILAGGGDSDDGVAPDATGSVIERPADAAAALADAEPGDAEAVRAFLASEAGQPLAAIPVDPPTATCDSDLAALAAPEVVDAAVAVPDRWLNEAALAAVSAADDVRTACEAGEDPGPPADGLDRGVALYGERLEQLGVDR